MSSIKQSMFTFKSTTQILVPRRDDMARRKELNEENDEAFRCLQEMSAQPEGAINYGRAQTLLRRRNLFWESAIICRDGAIFSFNALSSLVRAQSSFWTAQSFLRRRYFCHYSAIFFRKQDISYEINQF